MLLSRETRSARRAAALLRTALRPDPLTLPAPLRRYHPHTRQLLEVVDAPTWRPRHPWRVHHVRGTAPRVLYPYR